MMSQAVCLLVGLCRREEPREKRTKLVCRMRGKGNYMDLATQREGSCIGDLRRDGSFDALDDNEYMKIIR